MHRTEIFSPLVERAQRAIDRPMPVRKRTRPVDQRISRSRLSESGEDGVALYRNLQAAGPASSVDAQAAEEETSVPGDGALTGELSRGDERGQDRSDAAPAEDETSPTDDVLEEYTQPETERPLPRESVPSPPVEPEPIPEPTPAPAVVRPTTPPAQTRRSMDEDAPLTPVASTGARLSRARPMSGHRDRFDENSVLAEAGESSLKRAGSGEARTVRGPRGKYPSPSPCSSTRDTTSDLCPPRQAHADRVRDRESWARWI